MPRRKQTNSNSPKKPLTPEQAEALKARLAAGRAAAAEKRRASPNDAAADAGSNSEAQLPADGEAQAAFPAGSKPAKPTSRKKRRPMPSPDDGGGESKADQRLAKSIAKTAVSIKAAHELAAMMTGLQSLVMTDQQALMLAAPVHECCKKYGLNLNAVMGPEVQLVLAAAMVYSPMLRMLQAEVEYKRQAGARPAGTQAADGTVVYPPQFHDAPVPPQAGAAEVTIDVPVDHVWASAAQGAGEVFPAQ